MDSLVIECTYEDDCSYLTDRTHVPMLAFNEIDEHLQEEHDTTLDDEIERLEEETGKSFEQLVREGGVDD